MNNRATQHYDDVVPVLIVGGSIVGLSTSLFLSWHGISSLLVERHVDTSIHARAMHFNQRTLELFHPLGLEHCIQQQENPPLTGRFAIRVESLAGKELDAQEQPAQPGRNAAPTLDMFSPVKGAMIGQDRLEPLVRTRAVELGSDIRFGTELLSFEQDEDGVTAFIRDKTSGVERVVRASYMVAADGNRSSIRQCLNIGTHGYGTLAYWLNILFQADLRQPLRGRDISMCFVNNPEVQGILAGREDSWHLLATFDAASHVAPEHVSEARCLELVRAAVGVPELDVKILSTGYWEVAARVADSYQQGRVFLVGDAAHVMTPMGAFGANTGIADVHNLAWKLAYVLKGNAEPALLTTYQSERQPVAELATGISLGLYVHRLSHQENSEAVKKASEAFLSRVVDNLEQLQPTPYSLTLGYRYRSSAIVADTEDTAFVPFDTEPAGRPGSRAPHVVLKRAGQEISTLDLYGRNFVLLTGANGESWQQVGREVAQHTGLELDIYSIGNNGDYDDCENGFLRLYGITDTGAVLVRPDGYIAWRSASSAEDAELALEHIFSCVLMRQTAITQPGI